MGYVPLPKYLSSSLCNGEPDDVKMPVKLDPLPPYPS